MDTSTSHPADPSCWSRALQTELGDADPSWACHNSIMTPVEMRVILCWPRSVYGHCSMRQNLRAIPQME